MESQKITVSRGMFNVRQGGNPDGFPVVLLHGWPESSHCWEGVAAHLDPSLRVIAPDLRGLGDSERTLDVKAYRKIELAKDMIAVLDEMKIETFALVGHDWGGIVAQEIAFLVPERIKQLVIMNIPILSNTAGTTEAIGKLYSQGAIPFWYQYFQMQPNLPEKMIKGNEDVWIRHFFGRAGMDGTIPAESIEEYIRCYSIENTPGTAANYYRVLMKDREHWATLGGKVFPMPTLYIYGKRDMVIIPENLNHIEDCFVSIRVETVDTAHFVQDEKPAEVAAFMNDFFQPLV